MIDALRRARPKWNLRRKPMQCCGHDIAVAQTCWIEWKSSAVSEYAHAGNGRCRRAVAYRKDNLHSEDIRFA